MTFFTQSETRYLSGPIIWPGRAWEFPERLLAMVPLARWIQIRRGLHDEA